ALTYTVVSAFLRHRAPLGLHSFPTRRSSDLRRLCGSLAYRGARTAANSSSDRVSSQSVTGIDARCDSRVSTRFSGDGLCRGPQRDRKSTRLNSSHLGISYAVFCLKKKNKAE